MRYWSFLAALLFCLPCYGQIKEFAHVFDVDPNEEVPLLWRLEKEFAKAVSEYDWRYDYSWNMPKEFDADFKQNIADFGATEMRLQNPDEERIYRALMRIPKEFYPYIGPELHTVRGLSGKILDLPGIKETKNKFPTRIASVFKDIPNIEFVSPVLYFYLMPELWGEGANSIEYPVALKQRPRPRNIKINPELLAAVKRDVPLEDYTNGHWPQQPDPGVRHFYADKNTPLSGADVVAFMATVDGLSEFINRDDNELRLILLDALMNYYDEKNGVDKNAAFLKGAVNPCQTIARKIKWYGMRAEFQKYIGEQGFGLDDWAYTCDKTLKAYRVATMPTAYVTGLKFMRNGTLYKMMDRLGFDAEERRQQRYFIEASIQLYDTTDENIAAVTPYTKQLRAKWQKLGEQYGGTPLIIP